MNDPTPKIQRFNIFLLAIGVCKYYYVRALLVMFGCVCTELPPLVD